LQFPLINETFDFLSSILKYSGVLDIANAERYKGFFTSHIEGSAEKEGLSLFGTGCSSKAQW
jgi:hypothetical protein